MKPSFLLLLFTTIMLFSCSDDNANENPDSNTDTDGDVIETRDYVDAIVSTSSNGSQELRFIYDSDNNLVRNETDTYFREYTYSGNNITKIESITLPDTPFYTVNFIYDNQGRISEVKRDNHHNNSLYYVTYEYDSNNRVTLACTYTDVANYNDGICNRFYNFTYQENSTNYEGKALTLITSGVADILEVSTWVFDEKERPYFGEAVERIQLPYATDGTGMDWEYTYNTNNPLSKHIFDFDFNENRLRRSFEYTYNSDDLPALVTINTYNTFSGDVISTFSQNFSYISQ